MARRKNTEDASYRRFRQLESAEACSASVSYQLPRAGKPYFLATCACGWTGWPQSSSKKAFSEARRHTPKVAGAIFGMGAKGRPQGR